MLPTLWLAENIIQLNKLLSHLKNQNKFKKIPTKIHKLLTGKIFIK